MSESENTVKMSFAVNLKQMIDAFNIEIETELTAFSGGSLIQALYRGFIEQLNFIVEQLITDKQARSMVIQHLIVNNDLHRYIEHEQHPDCICNACMQEHHNRECFDKNCSYHKPASAH